MDSRKTAWAIGGISFFLFLFFQAQGIAGGDSGDLVTAAVTHGVAHPPGYPLYTFLGWIVSHIPVFTPAWRVALISSISHATVLVLVYLLVVSITKRKIVGVFSALLLLANYLFFLYSVTPEVFALLDFFVIALIYLLIRKRSLYIVAFLFGLSLTHHHMILFLVPAGMYWVWGKKFRYSHILWFIAGLVPYLYVTIAARSSSIINWDRPVDVAGFIRLLSRADYGTFLSGGGFGAQVIQRFLQIQAYGQFVLLDFTWIGVMLILVGLFSLWKRQRRLFVFFILALLFLGPAFFFYASFPLLNWFTLGTYERFLLPSYVLLAVVSGIGLSEIVDRIQFVFTTRARLILGIGCVIIFLYPLSQLGVTLWRFYGLPNDRTADNLAKDILSPLPRGSIVFLGRDTTLFSVQYMRYALLYRPDVLVIHTSRLSSPDYQITLHTVFPEITFSGSGNTLQNLVASQSSQHRIFSNTPLAAGPGHVWVPYGLTYELVDEQHQPAAQVMYDENLSIWKTLHDPTKGILSRYNHLMLSDVRDVYAGGRIALGKTLVRGGELEEAYMQFQNAAAVAGDSELSNAYMYEGQVLSLQKKCPAAIAKFKTAQESSVVPNPDVLNYEAVTYRDCVGDAKKAKELFDEYNKQNGQTQTPIEQL